MKFDFLTFSVSLLAVSHSQTLCNSRLTTSSRVRKRRVSKIVNTFFLTRVTFLYLSNLIYVLHYM